MLICKRSLLNVKPIKSLFGRCGSGFRLPILTFHRPLASRCSSKSLQWMNSYSNSSEQKHVPECLHCLIPNLNFCRLMLWQISILWITNVLSVSISFCISQTKFLFISSSQDSLVSENNFLPFSHHWLDANFVEYLYRSLVAVVTITYVLSLDVPGVDPGLRTRGT